MSAEVRTHIGVGKHICGFQKYSLGCHWGAATSMLQLARSLNTCWFLILPTMVGLRPWSTTANPKPHPTWHIPRPSWWYRRVPKRFPRTARKRVQLLCTSDADLLRYLRGRTSWFHVLRDAVRQRGTVFCSPGFSMFLNLSSVYCSCRARFYCRFTRNVVLKVLTSSFLPCRNSVGATRTSRPTWATAGAAWSALTTARKYAVGTGSTIPFQCRIFFSHGCSPCFLFNRGAFSHSGAPHPLFTSASTCTWRGQLISSTRDSEVLSMPSGTGGLNATKPDSVLLSTDVRCAWLGAVDQDCPQSLLHALDSAATKQLSTRLRVL